MKIMKIFSVFVLTIILFGLAAYADENKKESIKLSLYETLSLAMQNNFDVQLNIYDRLIKGTELDLARSVFDTSLTITGDYEYD